VLALGLWKLVEIIWDCDLDAGHTRSRIVGADSVGTRLQSCAQSRGYVVQFSICVPHRQFLDIFINFHSFVRRGTTHATSAIDAARLWRGRETILSKLQTANVSNEA
jgi:hypothetical protein